jgi:hypothetical protein
MSGVHWIEEGVFRAEEHTPGQWSVYEATDFIWSGVDVTPAEWALVSTQSADSADAAISAHISPPPVSDGVRALINKEWARRWPTTRIQED